MSEKDQNSKEATYIPRFNYKYCIDKIIAFNRYGSRPCGPSKFATEALGLKGVGTISTAFSCLNQLGWISKVGKGKYDLDDLGMKIARNAELGLKSDEANLARQTCENVQTLSALANYMKIKKRQTFDEIKTYIATAWGKYYKFSRKYLDALAQNMISFLEAAKLIRYDSKEAVFGYTGTAEETTPSIELSEKTEEMIPIIIGEARYAVAKKELEDFVKEHGKKLSSKEYRMRS